MLTIHDLNYSISHKEILHHINYSTELDGKFVGIMGPNGAGKSTLLKCMTGLLPYKGRIDIDGASPSSVRHHIAYVPQKSVIDLNFPITVENVILSGSYESAGWFSFKNQNGMYKVNELLKSLELMPIRSRMLSELSGGQLQRVLIARSLMADRTIYLLDEPFTGIDYKSTDIILAHLKALKSAGKTIIIVHHDIDSAPRLFDEMIFLNKTIIESGPVNDVFNETNLKKTFFNQSEVTSHALH